jgi:intracellular sulfur oxidation DsrE/DsrF family protein
MGTKSPTAQERRSFLTYLNAGAASLAAMVVGSTAMAQEKPKVTARWEPTRHDKDDWLELPGKHRLVFDTTNVNGVGEAIFFANNFMRVNRSDYGLQNSDLAVVIIVRHNSTPFGYSDAIWAKYGATIAGRSGLEDPKSKVPPKANMFNSGDYGELLSNRGVTLDTIFRQGVQFAVCSSATRAIATLIARSVGADVETINSELIANLVSNSRMVPAGIVAVNRAQERGYSLVKT